MLCVIPIVARLAQGSEIFWSAIFGDMVEVGNCKHNLNHLTLSIGYYRMILSTAELAAIVSPLQDLFTYLLPVLWIAALIFRSYRHGLFSFQCFLHTLSCCHSFLAGAETVAAPDAGCI